MGNSPARRARLREQRAAEATEYAASVALLRQTGARCASCRHCDRMLVSDKRHCALDSDFEGYQPVAHGHLCLRYSERPATPAAQRASKEGREDGE